MLFLWLFLSGFWSAALPTIASTVDPTPHTTRLAALAHGKSQPNGSGEAAFAAVQVPPKSAAGHCLNTTEQQLAQIVNSYRESRGLTPIALSASLSRVARLHAQDAAKNYRDNPTCNMHSWSDQGPWRGCCYKSNHADMDCMQMKPKELTTYPGRGYEISYMRWWSDGRPSVIKPNDALESWKGSRGHHEVIINGGVFAQATWRSMGIGVVDGYACIWFGEEEDPAGKPTTCD